MSKLSAIVRYEVLMAWRRRSLLILWVLLLVGVVGFSLLVANVNRQSPVMDQAVQASASDPNAPPWVQGIDLVVATHTLSLINVLIAGMVFYTVGVTLLLGVQLRASAWISAALLLVFALSMAAFQSLKLSLNFSVLTCAACAALVYLASSLEAAPGARRA